MPLGLIMGIARGFRRKRTASLDILSPKRAPRNFYKGKNCKPTGFHTRKGGYVVVPDKLPNYVVPDLTGFKVLWFEFKNKASFSGIALRINSGIILKTQGLEVVFTHFCLYNIGGLLLAICPEMILTHVPNLLISV